MRLRGMVIGCRLLALQRGAPFTLDLISMWVLQSAASSAAARTAGEHLGSLLAAMQCHPRVDNAVGFAMPPLFRASALGDADLRKARCLYRPWLQLYPQQPHWPWSLPERTNPASIGI